MPTSFWKTPTHAPARPVQFQLPQLAGAPEGEHPLRGLLALALDPGNQSWSLMARKTRASSSSWHPLREGTGPVPTVEEAVVARTGWLNRGSGTEPSQKVDSMETHPELRAK